MRPSPPLDRWKGYEHLRQTLMSGDNSGNVEAAEVRSGVGRSIQGHRWDFADGTDAGERARKNNLPEGSCRKLS